MLTMPNNFHSALRFVLCGLALSACTLLTGCGDGGLVSVEGKVTVDGKAVSKGNVRFVPDKTKGNSATAEPTSDIGSDGAYQLRTQGKSGAAPGWYKVSIVSQETPDSTKPNAPVTSYVAAKFGDPEKSGISIEVVSSAPSGAYDLKATSK
jgi:hypothetical protein